LSYDENHAKSFDSISLNMDEVIATNSTLYMALQYLQCADCFYVGKAGECWMKSDKPCPNCGADSSPTTFPDTWYSQSNFPILQQLYVMRKEVAPAVLVMAIFITESILSECVEQSLRKKKVSSDVINATLDNLKGSEQLANYLARLANAKSIEQVLARQPEILTLWERWKKLRTMRNHIAHGKKYETKQEEAEEAFQVCCSFHTVARYILNAIS
jgi:hypothetical protein